MALLPLISGSVMAAATAAAVFDGLGRPAFWLDEGATGTAVRRSWGDLWMLVQGADAPLVPYYALLKLLVRAGEVVAPGAQPEILCRWPSAIGVVVAGALLIAWLTRRGGLMVAVAAGGVFLLLDGVTRYAQEARPYGLVLMLAVLTTVIRPRAVTSRLPWMVLYAVGIAGLVVLNTLTISLVLAHLVAAAATGSVLRRWTDVAQNALAAAAGLLICLPQAFAAASDGGGATRFPPLTPAHLGHTFLRLFTPDGHVTPAAVLILLLALLGLTQLFSDRYGYVTRVAAAWALAPLTLLLPAVVARPNLQIARYLLFTVPGWAALAGVGLVAVGSLAGQALAVFTGPRPAWVVETVAVTASIALGLTLLATDQAPGLRELQEPAGHGDDIRPIVSASHEGMPVFMASRLAAVEFIAYDRSPARDFLNITSGQDLTSIWPTAIGPYDVRQQLLRNRQIELVVHNATDLACLQLAVGPDRRTDCLPTLVFNRHYQAWSPPVYGTGWACLVLTRPTPSRI